MQTVSQEALAEAASCTSRQLAPWVKALSNHGLPLLDGRVQLDHAVAVGAALRFSQAGIGKPRVNAIFERLLRTFPKGDDWLLVDRRNRSQPISVEKAPFVTGKSLSSKNRIPVVFDPATFIERLNSP